MTEKPAGGAKNEVLADEAFERALELDRRGDDAAADRWFTRARDLDPAEYPLPLRLDSAEFERIVANALDSLPERFLPYLVQVSVIVRDYPTPEQEASAGDGLLGLYEGVPRTERGEGERDMLDRVFVFKREHEIEFPDPAVLADQVRRTVVHEIGHHFGLGEEDMGEYA